MVVINMMNLNRFNSDYKGLNNVLINEKALDSIWEKIVSKYTQVINEYFPSHSKFLLDKPYRYKTTDCDVHHYDIRYNIIIECTNRVTVFKESNETRDLLELFMKKILAKRIGTVFGYEFKINGDVEHMWNYQPRFRVKGYSKKSFNELLETFEKDSTDEAKHFYECVTNDIYHEYKFRTSKYVNDYVDFRSMIADALFTITSNDDIYTRFIITSHVNGEFKNTKYGVASPYTFIAFMANIFKEFNLNSLDSLCVQTSLQFYRNH